MTAQQEELLREQIELLIAEWWAHGVRYLKDLERLQEIMDGTADGTSVAV